MRSNHNQRGSALAMGMLVSVLISGLVMTIAWSASIQSQVSRNIMRANESFYAAESAGQLAWWRFKHDNTYRTGAYPLTGTYAVNGTTYNYSVTCADSIAAANLAWKFDEGTGGTTADASGNGNTGTLQGGVTWTTGRSNNALLFNGSTGYVNCGNSASTNLVGCVSMSAWIKLNGAASDQKVGANQNGYFGGYKMSIYNSKVEFEVRDATGWGIVNRNVSGGTLLTVGTWYHVVGIFDSNAGTITTYVNGQLDRQLTGVASNALASTTGNFIIGREPFDATLFFFNGIIDDVRVFNRALTAAEVLSLYDTSVTISATVTGGRVSNQAAFQVSIPTPPAPVPPALAVGGNITLKNVTITGECDATGSISGTSSQSTINGNIVYGNTYSSSKITQNNGTLTKNASYTAPTIDYTSLQNQAAQTYNSSQSGTQFAFNNLGGTKVIYVNGNVTDPTFYIGGTFPSGGTLYVHGNVTFSNNAATIGQSGFPIYIVCTGDMTTGSGFNIIGGIYCGGDWSFKSGSVDGPIVVNGNATSAASSGITFNTESMPFFDPRITNNAASLPSYVTGFH